MTRFKVKKSRDRRFLSDNSLKNIFGRYTIIDRRFQFKYTKSLMILVCSVVTVANLLILYFTYDYFRTIHGILLEHLPNLLTHLEREFWIILFMALGTPVLLGLLLFFYGMRATGRFIAPVVILKEHMKNLGRGEWFHAPVQIRREDEFQELIEAYNYFYTALRKISQKDVAHLEGALHGADMSDLKLVVRDVVEEKKLQIEKPISPD